MKYYSTFVALLIALFTVSCSENTVSSSESVRVLLPEASAIYVHEGLPHQSFEHDLLKSEEAKNKTIQIGGFPFYTPKVEVKQGDELLRKVLSAATSYIAFKGEKECGGFHPDYAVSWEKGGEEYAVLICYGCKEVMIIAPKKSYRHDIHSTALSELKPVLAAFQKLRPKKE